MAGNGTPKSEDALVVLLASGATTEEAADGSGFSVRTVFRRLEDDSFRARINDVKRVSRGRAVDKILSLRLKHIENIDRLSGADPLPEGVEPEAGAVRLNASKAIIELGSKLLAEHDLEQRVRALEERLAQQGQAVQP